jgi:hypothetical protein
MDSEFVWKEMSSYEDHWLPKGTVLGKLKMIREIIYYDAPLMVVVQDELGRYFLVDYSYAGNGDGAYREEFEFYQIDEDVMNKINALDSKDREFLDLLKSIREKNEHVMTFVHDTVGDYGYYDYYRKYPKKDKTEAQYE